MKKMFFVAVVLFYFAGVCAQELIKDIPVPEGYSRVIREEGSFGKWLSERELKGDEAQVYDFENNLISNQSAHFRVLDIDVMRDQECADAVMRLRADYLYEKGDYDKISFNFVSGFKADYSKWRDGYFVRLDGNDASWVETDRDQTTYESYRRYLRTIFAYANTHSLRLQMQGQRVADMKAGDVFVQGGFPGHAIIVVDVAENATAGDKIFLLAQSYMPAQSIHILKNTVNETSSPWYRYDIERGVLIPTWPRPFMESDLFRF